MKSLELELTKRLLIVESDSTMVEGQYEADVNGRHIELICKGYELTEEIAKGFSKAVKSSHDEDGFIQYMCEIKNITYSPAFVTALNSFISAIESKGYYWGENPLPIPSSDDINWFRNQIKGDFSERYTNVFNWFENQSKTFNPEKTLIFEILL